MNKEAIKKFFLGDGKHDIKGMLLNLAFFAFAITYFEIAMHAALFSEISARIVYVVLFSVAYGAVMAVLSGVFARRVNTVISYVMLGVVYIWYCVQYVYYLIFGNFISAYLIKMGGEAITNFIGTAKGELVRSIPMFLILAIPFVLLALGLKFKLLNTDRRAPVALLCELCVCVLLFFGSYGAIYAEGTGAFSIYDIYHNTHTQTDTSIKNLGFITTLRLELSGGLMSADGGEVNDQTIIDDVVIMDKDELEDILGIPTTPQTKPNIRPSKVTTGTDTSTGTGTSTDTGSDFTTDLESWQDTTNSDTTEDIYTPPEIIYYDQVLDIDFDALKAKADAEGNSVLSSMHEYFGSQMYSKTNDYTGMFAGKNLIFLVCESLSPAAIDPEITPTLYKLANEGFKFNNFYGTFKSVTTNGEYAACTGLFPDMTRAKTDGSFNASRNNYMPFTLGNMFREWYGIESRGYHNYLGSYYNRKNTHKNIGYSTLKFMNDPLKFSCTWPSSDLEMMEQTVSDFSSDELFHTYYMTFSGHYQYNWENPMCAKNRDLVAHLDYSEAAKAYLACHIELDRSLEYMMAELEAKGTLEDTVIVLTTDHYPYGLKNNQYNEFFDANRDEAFGIYKNCFILWADGMEDPIEIDTPCCTVDILPTLLNLFDMPYDSRLLMGRDVLDPASFHVAILHNKSFITDKVMFNAETGKVTYLVDPDTLSPQYVDAVKNIVNNEFAMSALILNNDYYRVVFGK